MTHIYSDRKKYLIKGIREISNQIILNPGIDQLERLSLPSKSFSSGKTLIFIHSELYEKFEKICKSFRKFHPEKMTKNQIKQLGIEMQVGSLMTSDTLTRALRWIEEDKIYAQIHIVGEPIKALELAENSLSPYIDLLRYII